MTDRICLLLEALSVVVCLHHLYGEKFRLDIKTVGFLAVDMIMMTAIQFYEMSQMVSFIIFPIIVIYCGIRFGVRWETIIINNILYVIIISSVQYIMIVLTAIIAGNYMSKNRLLSINICTFLFVVLVLSKLGLNKISLYFHNKERLLIISLSCSVLVVFYCLLQFKNSDRIHMTHYTILFICTLLIVVLAVNLGKYKVKSKEIETELKMHELYANSYETLIENVRMRQHEFDNHISTIYSQHLFCGTYESLVEVQKEYCKELEKENRYNKLLKYDNPVIRGFLYVKFMEAEKLGIEISYKIVIDSLDIKMPVYKIVEVLGDLINNAVEALAESEEEKKLHVSIIEIEDKVEIEVRNTSRYISNKERSKFFEKGYSGKGENRGLGLYNVKKICEEYGFEIICDNKIIVDVNWLLFLITNTRDHLI